LTRKHNSKVFINKEKVFHKVVKVADLEALVTHMTDTARLKADTKIDLFEKIDALRSRELQAEILARKAQVEPTANGSEVDATERN
jgi:glutamine synthetase type III